MHDTVAVTARFALALAGAGMLGLAHHQGQLTAFRHTITQLIRQQTTDRTDIERELDTLREDAEAA